MEVKHSCCRFVKREDLIAIGFALALKLNCDPFTLDFIDYAEVMSYYNMLINHIRKINEG